MAELTPAPQEFYDRIQRLIAAYFPHLADARFSIQLRDTGRINVSESAWGEVDTPDDPEEAQRTDFTMWYAADVWQTLDERQRDALMFHELHHCGWDADGKPLLLLHDVEVFNDEIAQYGLWWPKPQVTIEALQQMPPPHDGAEGIPEMPLYQKPQHGNYGSTGAGNYGSTGAGNYGSTGAGNYGSTGARASGVMWSDPDLEGGGEFYTVVLNNGRSIELSPAAWAAAAQSIVTDLLGELGTLTPGGD